MTHDEKTPMKIAEQNSSLKTSELEALSKRLDECFKLIKASAGESRQHIVENGADDVLLKHGYIYASFLSDLIAGRITGSRHDLTDLLRLIRDFCEIIESDSKLISEEVRQ